MVDREASPAHIDRPAPDEPWRFTCPECGGTAVDSLAKTRVRRGHDEFNFYCRTCEQKLEFVIDRQTDSPVYAWETQNNAT